MFRRLAGFVCGFALVTATPALAQTPSAEKIFVNLSAGLQIGTSDVNSVQTFDLYAEPGTLTSAIDVKGGFFFDGQAGYRIGRNLAVGIGVTFVDAKSDATINASIPHPIFFDQNRSVGATAPDLTHRETWVAGLVTYVMPVTDKIDVFVSGGPAMVQVQQEIPTSATVTEPDPTLSAVGVTQFSKSGIGFVVGADVRYLITDRVGLGITGKFSVGSVDLTDDTKVDAGGFQVGGGLRIRF
jgi:opacity protein-like surface antigen